MKKNIVIHFYRMKKVVPSESELQCVGTLKDSESKNDK